MSTLLEQLASGFLPRLLAGMTINLQIAAIALAAGLVLGLLLALARLGGGLPGFVAAGIIGLMRAAPTFVVMFFLLNAVPHDAMLLGIDVAPSGLMTVALSLVPYSAAYVADAGLDAMRQLRGGKPAAALLFLPNVTRAFFVLVMSSGAGAAVGVTEGIAVILREAERLPSLGSRMVLFAIGIAAFGIVLQSGFTLMRIVQTRLTRIAVRNVRLTPS